MRYEVITKTLVTKIYYVEAESEKEAMDFDPNLEPSYVDEDHEEVVAVNPGE